MSPSLAELETFAAMVGFRYASMSVDTVTLRVTLQCEDHDGMTLTVEADNADSAMAGMMAKLGSLVDGMNA
jgi:hypothetical protein